MGLVTANQSALLQYFSNCYATINLLMTLTAERLFRIIFFFSAPCYLVATHRHLIK